MLKALKFVQGAVAKKDFVPALNHFQIKDKRIISFNGSMTLSSPIGLDLTVTPKALPFIKAIQECKETVSLHITKSKRLAVKSGSFKAYINCIEPEDFPYSLPMGENIKLDGNILPAFKKIHPFIAEDASRPWARGILMRGQSCFATNNIALIEYWHGSQFPVVVNIPEPAIRELLRIKEEPESIQVDSQSITFHYSDGRWLKSNLYDIAWPDIEKVLSREANPSAFPVGLDKAVESLAPFVDDLERIYFIEGKVSTTKAPEEGASMDLKDLPASGIYHRKQLQLVQSVATTIDFSLYPAPCIFYGDRLRGALVGMRDS